VVIVGHSIEILGIAPWIAVILGLAVGAGCGIVNGFFISRFRLNSFVVTLATSFIFQGLVNGISKGRPYSKIPVIRCNRFLRSGARRSPDPRIARSSARRNPVAEA